MDELCAMVWLKSWSLEKRSLSFEECGIKYDPPTARIIGGADVTSHRWSFAVFIRQNYRDIITNDGRDYLVRKFLFFLKTLSIRLKVSSSWSCGGTLINHKTILTAVRFFLIDERWRTMREILLGALSEDGRWHVSKCWAMNEEISLSRFYYKSLAFPIVWNDFYPNIESVMLLLLHRKPNEEMFLFSPWKW